MFLIAEKHSCHNLPPCRQNPRVKQPSLSLFLSLSPSLQEEIKNARNSSMEVVHDWTEAEIEDDEEPLATRRRRSRNNSTAPPDAPARSASAVAAAADDDDDGEVNEKETRYVEQVISSLRERSARPRLTSPPDIGTGSAAVAGYDGEALVEKMETVDVDAMISSLSLRGSTDRLSSGAPARSAAISGDGAEEPEEHGEEFSFPVLQKPSNGDGAEEHREEFSFPVFQESSNGDGAEEHGDEFSFPVVQKPSNADTGNVLDLFAAAEAARKVAARKLFVEQTMSCSAGPRTDGIKKELLADHKAVDVAELERWLRRKEAVDELAWFTAWCSDEEKMLPPLELFEYAFRALDGARSSELNRYAHWRRYWIGPAAVPEFFICPVSNKLMEHPVVITTGMTVDRSALEKWWLNNERICPVTKEVITHSIFIPNNLIAQCISLWREENSISDATTHTAPPPISPEKQAQFNEATLFCNSQSCSRETYCAILRLLELVNREGSSFLHLLGCSPGTIAKLSCILPGTCQDPNPELDDITLQVIAKAAAYSPNKEIIGDDPYAIPVLIARALLGPIASRVKCVQILELLADNYYNKIKIGELGGIAAMVELLYVGNNVDFKKTVASAIASLCEARENWSRFVKDGVADAAISVMQSEGLVDEACRIMLQADGFDYAMLQVIKELESFPGDKFCYNMIECLWNSYIRSKLGRKTGDFLSSSSSSSEVAWTDVKKIVSWLQKKRYFPRTYKYRG